MPRCVVGSAFQYYKRFYLNNSVMDFHPKHIVVTCVYLAAKVEEFNVSMAQFVANVRGDREKASAIVLNNELFLMQQLKYHLTVHNPLRSIEGFLIDIKTRFSQCGDPEKLRPHIDHFIEMTFSTNACFLLSPSQIALSAVVYAASKVRVNLDGYVIHVSVERHSPFLLRYLTNLLFVDRIQEIQYLQSVMSTLWTMVNSEVSPPKEKVKQIEKKLENCRNQSNNPDSREYKRSLDEEMADESTIPYEKYSQICEEQERSDRKLIETSGTSSQRSK